MKRQHVETWLRSTHPGETLRAYLVGGPANGDSMDASDAPGSRHRADLQVHVAGRQLDVERRIAPYSNLCAVVSERALALATNSSAYSDSGGRSTPTTPRPGTRSANARWMSATASKSPPTCLHGDVERLDARA